MACTWQHWGQKDTISNLGRAGGHVCFSAHSSLGFQYNGSYVAITSSFSVSVQYMQLCGYGCLLLLFYSFEYVYSMTSRKTDCNVLIEYFIGGKIIPVVRSN